jgi:DNA-binding NarL/FixJ family response regulator
MGQATSSRAPNNRRPPGPSPPVAAGHNNHQIAERLSLSGKTVANHVSAIFAKLQVADRTQAILRARDAGLGHP